MADDEDQDNDGEVRGHVEAPAHAVVDHDLAAAPDQSELSTGSAPPMRAHLTCMKVRVLRTERMMSGNRWRTDRLSRELTWRENISIPREQSPNPKSASH